MRCPRCNDVLNRIDYEGMPICTCPACGGEFVDHHRLQSIENRREVRFEKAEAERLKFTETGPERDEQLLCPRCGNSMIKKICGSADLIVDYCRACRGIWLDDEELEKVQVLAEQEAARREQPPAERQSVRAALGRARASFAEGRGESTAGQGYVRDVPLEKASMTRPRLWVRLTCAALIVGITLVWFAGLAHSVLPLGRFLRPPELDTAGTIRIFALLFLVAYVVATTRTKVTTEFKRRLTVTRFLAGFPLTRRYSISDIAGIGTDYVEPGYAGNFLLVFFVNIILLGRPYLLYDREPVGKSYLYIILKKGKRVCLYKGRNDEYVGKLADFLRSKLGLKIRRL